MAESVSAFENEIAAFEAADKRDPPPPGAVLFTGSSTIRLWKTLESDFPLMKVLNRGFGGSQVPDLIDVAGRIISPYAPRQVVIYSGDNDLGAGKTVDRVFADFRALTDRIRSLLPGQPMTFISVKPSLLRWKLAPQIREVNRRLKRFAMDCSGVSFVDVYTPMLGHDRKPRPDLYAADGLHLSPKGYVLWAERVGRLLGRVLREPARRQKSTRCSRHPSQPKSLFV